MLYALVVLACASVGPAQNCDVLQSPIVYSSEARCVMQGAILAGRYKAQFGSTAELRYKVECRPQDGELPPQVDEATAQRHLWQFSQGW